MAQIDEHYQARLAEDPGDEVFADYAELLRQRGKFAEAIQVSLAGLSANPSQHRGRLILARAFFESGYLPFALRELEQLKQELPDNQFVLKLIDRLGGTRHESASTATSPRQVEDSGTMAEEEFNLDDLEELGKEEK